jgi:murein DD-endopeptidase MepM/ murein hydrolase activator NlpD
MFKKYFNFLFIFICLFCFLDSSSTANNSSYYFPTDYLYITSEYGYREIYNQTNFHTGTDFGAPQGSDIYSISSGVITHVGFINGYGNSIIILHSDGLKSLYAHLDENFIVNIGDKVNAHQLIAKVGPKFLSNGIQNGFTTGPHLHLTIYDTNNNTINPLSLNLEKYN